MPYRSAVSVFGVSGVIALIDLQQLFATDNDKCFRNRQTQNFVHRQQFSLTHTAGFTIFGSVVRYTPSTELSGFALDLYTDFTRTVADVFGCQFIHTAEEKLDIAVTQYLLPLILRITILQTGKILEHTAHTDVSGTDYADLPGQIRNNTARCQLFTKHMDRYR